MPVVDNIVAFDAITHSAYGLDIRAMPEIVRPSIVKSFSFSFAKSILINLHTKIKTWTMLGRNNGFS